MTKKFWKRLIIVFLALPILFFGVALSVLFFKQEQLVQHFLEEFNEDIEGFVVIGGSRLAPFKNFPYVSIDLKDVSVYESEASREAGAILNLKDIYVGFDMLQLLSGKTEIKTIALQGGYLNIVQNENAELNIAKAFKPKKPTEEISEAFNLKLKRIKLRDVAFSKLNEENQIRLEAFVEKGTLGVEKNDDFAALRADCHFNFTVIKNGDSTFFKNKKCHLNTDLSFSEKDMRLTFTRASLVVEKSQFGVLGTMKLADDFPVDLTLEGTKPSFDLFLSFAPEELAPVLERYDNAGNVYFNATIQGPTLNAQPHIEARFGCKETLIANQFNKKKIDELQFNAFFTNGDSNRLETMYFELRDFEARPEAGRFKGYLSVRNFSEPEIDMRVDSDFNLKFLTAFFELDNIYQLSGQVLLQMNFHDIVDLKYPQKSLSKLEQAYYAKLRINNLSFVSPDFHLPIQKIDVVAETIGDSLVIQKVDAKIGNSDLLLHGSLSNFIDLIHHTDKDVVLDIHLNSKLLDLEDITKSKRNPDEFIADKIKNFKTHFSFSGSAKDLTEFQYLPQGRFVLDDLNATFQNYPHRLHDFDIDLRIDDEILEIKKFHGEIDDSDIDLQASMLNFMMFLKDDTSGTANISFKVASKKMILKDLLTYNGANYLPEDYRDEVFEKLILDGQVALSFKENEWVSTALNLDKMQAKMRMHPLKLEDFRGGIKLENKVLTLESFSGKLGKSKFSCYMKYYLGTSDEGKKKPNYFKFHAPRLDVDELTNFSPPKKDEQVNHAASFNIYDLPFSNMTFDVKIGELNYHNQRIIQLETKLRTTVNHFLYLDELGLEVAGGRIRGSGYFDGSNPKKIVLSPELSFEKIDLTKLLLKFDNFGQDALVSDNLIGKMSGNLRGKIKVHPDLVPCMDESDIQLDFAVYQGVLLNYAPMRALEDFFKDKNLNRVAFDTLQNSLHVKNGNLTIPSMAINTSLGFIIVEGTQDKNSEMNYLVRVPFRMVTQVASQKLFKRKKEEVDPEQEDEIVYFDPNRRTTFVNVRISGTPEAYKVTLERNKRSRSTRN